MVVELFHRINTYGVKLSEQEIRSALNQGSSVKFLRYVAGLKAFKKVTQNKVKPERQKDMELCLSALSFMVLGYSSFKQNTYGSFLSLAMSALNNNEINIINGDLIDEGKALIDPKDYFYCDLLIKFNNGVRLAYEVFGEIAFIKEPSSKRSSISKQLFELIVTYFSYLNEEQKVLLLENSSKFIDLLYGAIKNDSREYADWDSEVYVSSKRGFMYSISTSTGKQVTVKYRFEAFKEILKKSTGLDITVKPLLEIK